MNNLVSVLDADRAALRRFWVFSDLQQQDPENARRCMLAGVEDFLSLRVPVDAVCYLGDSTEGKNLAHLREMADMQVRALARVDAPVYYAMGNHEMDYLRYAGVPGRACIPMRERIAGEPQWHTTERVDDWTFSADFGGLVLFFLSDHAAPDGSWCTTHCYLQNPARVPNPHDAGTAREETLRRLAAVDRPFFTFSHYGFPGGNRDDDEGPLQRELLPLPPNHIAHFYGHSHIGDAYWGKQNVFRQISTIERSAATQFDIASLENRRGSAVRSAVLEWYGGRHYGVFFRNHTERRWEKTYLQ